MQKHSMLVVMRATDFVNPGQIPVIVADFPLYMQQKKCQWKFPDEDMANLPDTHPAVHEAFMKGKFAVQRGDKKISLMALDQSQEHSIKFLKEDSGSKGLYAKQEEKEIN
ncbi:unnamed protein product [Boreogadus saida]